MENKQDQIINLILAYGNLFCATLVDGWISVFCLTASGIGFIMFGIPIIKEIVKNIKKLLKSHFD